MKKLRFFLLVIISFTSLHSFAQDNPLFRHLPPDANSIYQINVPAITAKLNWMDLVGKFPMNPKAKSGQDMMNIMKNPFATGIDISKDIFIATADKGNPDSAVYTTVLFHLLDSGKFVAYMTQQTPGLRFFSYPNKGRAAGKDKYGAAWDKDFAILTIVQPGSGAATPSHSPAAGQKAKPQSPGPNYAVIAAKRSFAALKGFDGSAYTTNEVFKAGFSDDADMHMWAPRGAGIGMLAKNFMNKGKGHGKDPGFSAAMSTLYQSKAYTLTALRFETGKITLKSTTAYPPDSLAFYSKFTGRPLNTDLIARLPKGKLLAMVNIHFDPAAINDVLDKSRMRNKLDSMLAKKGLTTDHIIRAFKGDFLVAVMDPADKPVDSSGKKQPSLFLVTTINDMVSFKELADKTQLLMKDTLVTDTTAGGGTTQTVHAGLLGMFKSDYTLQDNILVISGTKKMTDAWFSNTEKRNTDFIPARVKDSPFSLYIDLKNVISTFQDMSKGKELSEKDKKMVDAVDKLDAFTLTGGAIRDGKVETYLELKLSDASANSLNTLIKMMQ